MTANQQVGAVAERRIGRYAREAVRTAAFYAKHKLADRKLFASVFVYDRQHFLNLFKTQLDSSLRAAYVLYADLEHGLLDRFFAFCQVFFDEGKICLFASKID